MKRRKGQGALNAQQMGPSGPSSHPNNTLSMLGFIWVCAGLVEADSCDTLPDPSFHRLPRLLRSALALQLGS